MRMCGCKARQALTAHLLTQHPDEAWHSASHAAWFPPTTKPYAHPSYQLWYWKAALFDFWSEPSGNVYHVRHVSNATDVWQSISTELADAALSLDTGGSLSTEYSASSNHWHLAHARARV